MHIFFLYLDNTLSNKCIYSLQLWYFAIVQMFFSTHLGFGNIVTCAGRLYSKNNALWYVPLQIFGMCNVEFIVKEDKFPQD